MKTTLIPGEGKKETFSAPVILITGITGGRMDCLQSPLASFLVDNSGLLPAQPITVSISCGICEGIWYQLFHVGNHRERSRDIIYYYIYIT